MHKSFQTYVNEWVEACFGLMVAKDKVERNHRFIEEAIELVQACNCEREHVHQIVEYVYSRPVGDKSQEVGGVMVTLAALCSANKIYMEACGNEELTRCWQKIDQIREKQAKKKKDSALP